MAELQTTTNFPSENNRNTATAGKLAPESLSMQQIFQYKYMLCVSGWFPLTLDSASHLNNFEFINKYKCMAVISGKTWVCTTEDAAII